MTRLDRVRVRDSDLRGWSERAGAVLAGAALWSRFSPRAKAWGPRLVGRTIARRDRWLIRTLHGRLLAVEPSALDVYLFTKHQGGCMDKKILGACRALLRPGDVFWDIGANVGYFAIELAGLFGEEIQVVAIEPQPALARAIAISGALNRFPRLTVYDVLLGSANGTIDLFIPSTSTQASVVSRAAHARSIACRGLTLDSAVAAGVAPPSIVKMDVEGFELEVMRGALETLAQHQPMVILESDVNMLRFGYERCDLLELIERAAPYRFFFLTHHGFVPLTRENRDDLAYTDILACPDEPDALARVRRADSWKAAA